MNSRYSLWLLCLCCASLAGCANWQNRARQNAAAGSAATLSASPAPAALDLSGPGTSMGPPPPPVAPDPSDPFLTLPPAGTAASGERLDLGAPAPAFGSAPARETSHAAVPDHLYNLEKSGGSSKRVASATSESSRKSSTISRMAEKVDTSKKSAETKPAEKKSAGADRPSTLERLARESRADSVEMAEQSPSSLPRPSRAPEPVRSAAAPKPVPSTSSDSPAVAEPAPIDTTLLAQPVRKGSGNEEPKTESQGPQSRVIPNSKLFNGTAKPAIYPVSNPIADEQVDITQFS